MPEFNYKANLGLDLLPYEGLDTQLWVELTKIYNAIQNLARYTDGIGGITVADYDTLDTPSTATFLLPRYTRLVAAAGENLSAGNIVVIGFPTFGPGPNAGLSNGDPPLIYKAVGTNTSAVNFSCWKHGYVSTDATTGDLVELYTCGILEISGLIAGRNYGTHPSAPGALAADPGYETLLGVAISSNALYFNPTF